MEAPPISEPLIVLSYRRSKGELSSGAIIYWPSESEAEALHHFEDATYKYMLSLLSVALRDRPGTRAAIQRTDRPGLAPMLLSAEESDLFRHDPAAAIQARTVPPQVVHIGVDKPNTEPAPPPSSFENMAVPLTAGYDIRANFFGELVFVRAREISQGAVIECPYCGHWVAEGKGPERQAGLLPAFDCQDCGGHTRVEDLQERWAGVPVKWLLGEGPAFERGYFLPREWNKNGNWISKEELQKMYSRYLEEKETIR